MGKRERSQVAARAAPAPTINDRWDRLSVWATLLFFDHGIFRLVYLNERQITPRLRRSAQPAPHNIRRWAREGIKTVICLRNNKPQLRKLEMTACREAGLEYRELIVRATRILKPDVVKNAAAIFRDIEYPAVIHCKTGVDRAGLASALYLLIEQNADLRQAKRHLSLRYGHFWFGKTGIASAALEVYGIDHANSGVPFLEWSQTVYDSDAARIKFRKWYKIPLYRRFASGNWHPRFSGSVAAAQRR